MTCVEKYIQEHPDESISEVIKNFCPCAFYDIDDPEDCNGGVALNDLEECKLCWNREIPGTEESTEVKKEKETMCACKEILEYKNRVAELEAQLKRLNQTNEDLANKLAAERAKVERLEVMVATRDEEIDKLVKEIEEFEEAIQAKNKRIVELSTWIDKMDEARYIEQDIAATKAIYEFFRQARPIAIPKEEPIILPINELPYAKYAKHIHMKYKSLVDSGFSHDDAMALIPMWTDEEG